MALNSVWLKSGFDQSLSSSDNIESLTPNIGSPKTIPVPGVGSVYCYVLNTPQYSEGDERSHPNVGSNFAGFQQVVYVQEIMHRDTLAWLKSNYRGQVSVNLTRDSSVYADWNAWLRFQHDVDEGREWFRNVRWEFTLLEEIS